MLVHKFLDSIDESWDHHVDILKNSDKIKTMDLPNLFGNLRNHEQSKDQRRESIKGMKDIKVDKSVTLMSKESKMIFDLNDSEEISSEEDREEDYEF